MAAMIAMFSSYGEIKSAVAGSRFESRAVPVSDAEITRLKEA